MWNQTRLHDNMVTVRKDISGKSIGGKTMATGAYVEYAYVPIPNGLTNFVRFTWYMLATTNWSGSFAGYQGCGFGFQSGSEGAYGSTVPSIPGGNSPIAQGTWNGINTEVMNYGRTQVYAQFLGSAGNGGTSFRVDNLPTL